MYGLVWSLLVKNSDNDNLGENKLLSEPSNTKMIKTTQITLPLKCCLYHSITKQIFLIKFYFTRFSSRTQNDIFWNLYILLNYSPIKEKVNDLKDDADRVDRRWFNFPSHTTLSRVSFVQMGLLKGGLISKKKCSNRNYSIFKGINRHDDLGFILFYRKSKLFSWIMYIYI